MAANLARAVLIGAALLAASAIGPPGAGFALVLLPLPLLLVGAEAGGHALALCSMMTAALAGLAGGTPGAVGYVILVALPAAAVLSAARRGAGVEQVVLWAVATTAVAVSVIVLVAGGWPEVAAAARAAWDQAFDKAMEAQRHGGMSPATFAELEASREELRNTVLPLLPGLACLSLAAAWIVNLRLASRWVWIPQGSGWRQWTAPSWLMWVLIASGFGAFVPVRELAGLSGNVFIVTLGAYFAQGLAVVAFWLERFRVPRIFRWAAFGIVLLEQVVAAGVLALGVFDFWGDFRRLAGREDDSV